MVSIEHQNPNLENESNALKEEIRAVIFDSPNKIIEEHERSNASWLACLITRLSIVSINLERGYRNGQISTEIFDKTKNKLDELVQKDYALQKSSTEKGEDISDQEKESLLTEFRAIADFLI